MKSWQSWALLAFVGAALGAGASLLGDRDRATRVPAHAGLEVREGSQLLADGRLRPGRRATSGEVGSEAAERARLALSVVPSELRPALVQIDVVPSYAGGVAPVGTLEFQQDSRSIVVGAGGLQASRSEWLHEIAHVRLAGSRPRGPLARRLVAALEEGVADYFAAAVARDPVLGRGPEPRDLRHPPRVAASEWASLAVAGFDTQRAGWALAARLYERDPEGGSLLRDAVACLDGESALGSAAESPAAVIDAFLGACPVQGRARLARVLGEWLPVELHSPEVPT